ncbi:MAG: DNA polymerase IV [Mycoplasmoidaceae bacterium]|nr:MAG: DNA polymerase IV [Mycoplasmoidaceae bacterium]
MKTIFLIDMDSFFPSVEELLNPKLKGKPLIVAPDTRRSVVASSNYEARKYGIKAAMPLYKALNILPRIKIVSPHHEAYEEYHNNFVKLLFDKFTNKIQVMSIDECYLDVSELVKKVSPMNLALKIQNVIKSTLGLGCSIGISNNKFLAKMASKLKKPLGISVLYKEDLPTKLWPLDIQEMYMIGKATSTVLKSSNINTIGDLAKMNDTLCENIFGKRWFEIKQNANGISDDFIDTSISTPKSISNDHTFLHDTDDYDQIINIVRTEAETVWKQLVDQNLKTKTVALSIDDLNRVSHRKSKTLKNYITSFETLMSTLLTLYEANFINSPIRLVGVSLCNIIKE